VEECQEEQAISVPGFPPIFRLPWRESLSVLLMSAMMAGLLLARKWEGLGGAVAVAAVVAMPLIGMRGIGTWLFLVILGRLSRVVRPSERIAGDRFTAPLTMRGVGLEGVLFLSPQPLRLKLRKR
jgi:hypothetical protein